MVVVIYWLSLPGPLLGQLYNDSIVHVLFILIKPRLENLNK